MLALEHIPATHAVADGGYVFGDCGLGLETTERDALVARLMTEMDRLTPGDLAEILDQFSGAERTALIAALLTAGADPLKINGATRDLKLHRQMRLRRGWYVAIWLLSLASGGVSAFHGYRRNQNVGWAIWWFLTGMVFPVVTPVIAAAQGFGRPKTA
jgi:hypothetical protein